ncbi:lysozyme inhibitor LprI family protein [Pararhodobacter sp. SW119]|uniref:lysozyme inhibitor LprI family protein n=1 Tax=Pararhodobacter sp. SW119 TaxID=2780075 RepID=UPI001AE0DA98|nr:lysozyme inhibitor LprI family protein [Pararhodobacter sp. SW119]
MNHNQIKRGLLSLAALLVSGQPSLSADIFWAEPFNQSFVRAYPEPSFGDPLEAGSVFDLSNAPHLRIEGRIEPGDNERLTNLLRKKLPNWQFDMFNDVVVSMNSPGGDFYEGLAMSDTIAGFHVTTFVGPGDECLSSCAIAFLGGQNIMTRNNPPWPSRYLHDTAIVGFHAPFSSITASIPIPIGTPLNDRLTGQLADSFYGQARAAINEIAARMARWQVSSDFVFSMLSKGGGARSDMPLHEEYVLIDDYTRLVETSSVLLASEMNFPRQITVNGAQEACNFLTYFNTRRTFAVFQASLGTASYVNDDVIAAGRYVFGNEDRPPVYEPIETVAGRYPELRTSGAGVTTSIHLVPGTDPTAFFFDGFMPGLGPIQCSVFQFTDERWYVKTFNENVHASDQYGYLQGREWTPLELLDYETPYPVSEFVALGWSMSWIDGKRLETRELENFPEDIRAIEEASFNCDGDLDPAAQVICEYPELSAADGRMAAAYLRALVSAGPQVRDSQRRWIALRARLCRPEEIERENRRRRDELARCLFGLTNVRTQELLRHM